MITNGHFVVTNSIWLHLTTNFRNRAALNFSQSYTFKRYLQSLKLEQTANRGSRNFSTDNEDLPANTRKRNTASDEEDIANDLDMHSLIISSFGGADQQPASSENSKPSKQESSTTLVIDADQVIKEIESLYASNQSTPSKRYSSNGGQTKQRQLNKTDPLLSLDAATLLDVALQNWESNNNRLSADDYGVNLETFEYCHDDQEFHSLPANLNSDMLDQMVVSSPVLTATADYSHDNSSMKKITTSTGENQPELVEKLNQLTIVQLNELYMELEQIIQIRSEVLIQELALRDELEYEKEQKNQFISLLLSVQNKRRHYMTAMDRKTTGHHHHHNHSKRITAAHNGRLVRLNSNDSIRATTSRYNPKTGLPNANSSWLPAVVDLSSLGNSIKQSILPSNSSKSSPVYLTTVIPYTSSMIPIDSSTLDILIKRK